MTLPSIEAALGIRGRLKGRGYLLRIADWAPGELELVLDLADELTPR